ncbi:MAG: 30S ribosomal protein S20 [Acidobacteriota bacterium]
MANHRSAIKRIRQNQKRRVRNRSAMSEMRTHIKRYRSLLSENKLDEAQKYLSEVYETIDKTHRKGIIHANTAARHKSRLARVLASLQKK